VRIVWFWFVRIRSLHVTEFMEKLAQLSETIGSDRVETQDAFLDRYTVDNLRPGAVIFPRNSREVSEVVRMASRENLSIVPWGSGTKSGMGNPPSRLDLVVVSSRMDHMLDVDTANLTITVEAGVRFRNIQARLATEEDRCYLPLEDLSKRRDELICSDRSNRGCFLSMDPPFSDAATIGGIVAANSSGPRRLLYRFPRDLLLGVRFVAPNGDLVGTGGKTVKNVSGYDISKLMAGSCGGLGFICEMTFKLLPLPEKMETVLLSFRSFKDAGALAEAVLDTPLLPAAVEIMNRTACEQLSCRERKTASLSPYAVAVAMEAFGPAVERMKQEVLDMGRGLGAVGDACFSEDDHRRFWLTVSHLHASAANGFHRPVTLQLIYPISLTREVVGFAESSLSDRGIDHTLLVHAGTGACIIVLSGDTDGGRGGGTAVSLTHDLLARCRDSGGNLIIQSAPADLKPELKMWGDSGPDRLVMERIKRELDPSGIFSPGRFVGGL
jgi:glycolate oxidase FAD binding subunit